MMEIRIWCDIMPSGVVQGASISEERFLSMFKVVKEQLEHGGNTLLRNITVSPPSSEKSKKSPNTLKNGTVHSSELLGILYRPTRRFTPQDWNTLVRICSTVPVVSSLKREPIWVSTLLAKFANCSQSRLEWRRKVYMSLSLDSILIQINAADYATYFL